MTAGRPPERAVRPAGSSQTGHHRAANGPPEAACVPGTMPGAPVAATLGELGEVNEVAARFFRARLPGSWVPGYLASRGFGPGIQRRWQAP